MKTIAVIAVALSGVFLFMGYRSLAAYVVALTILAGLLVKRRT
jgi:hypothetical protein